jgi:hypothetical protein
MTVEATAHFDATAATAAAASTGDGGRGQRNAAAHVWLLLLKNVCGGRAH